MPVLEGFNLKKKYDFIYCRFFLHIDQNSERNFLDNVKKL